MRYDKPPLNIQQQSELLQKRGLYCKSIERLEHYLSHIGYYRLSAYCLPFEEPPHDPNSNRSHKFKDGTDFDQILGLYVFDRKLRLLVIEAIERVEVAVRSSWAREMSVKYSSHAYMDSTLFKCPWNHTRYLAQISAELEKSNEVFIVHYRNNYHEPFMPPIWAVVETMTLGSLSRWLENTKEASVKKATMKDLKMPTIEILEGVLHCLTPVRNVCAHHGRLWNRRFSMKLPLIKKLNKRLIPPDAPHHQAHYIYNYLVIIEFFMKTINPKSTWKSRLIDLLEGQQPDKHKAMGFPDNWREIKPWCD